MSEGNEIAGHVAGSMASFAFAVTDSARAIGQDLRVAQVQRQAFRDIDAVGAAGVHAVSALRALVADRDDEIAELRMQLADANRRLLRRRAA